MKKIYSLLLVCIAMLTSFSAKADDIFIMVTTDCADQLEVKPWANDGVGMHDPLVFDDGYADIYFNNATLRYLYITPSCDVKITIYDSEDEQVFTAIGNAGKLKSIPILANYDGGIVEINKYVAVNAKLKVDLDGDPSKLQFSFNSRQVALKAGAQELEFSPDKESRIYIQTIGVNSLYLVELDGTTIIGREQSAEGTKEVMQYNLTVADGQTLHIVTDYPDEQHPVEVIVEGDRADEFIRAISIDDEQVTLDDLKSVQAGSKVRVVGDGYNFKVLSSSINGESTSILTSSLSVIVDAPQTIKFVVEYIERPYEYVIYNDAETSWAIYGSIDSQFSPVDGYSLCHFADGENPFKITSFGLLVDLGDKGESYVILNDQLLGVYSAPITTEIAEGDVLKLMTGTTLPTLYNVSYELQGLSDIDLVTDLICHRDWEAGHQSYKGTLVQLNPLPGEEITKVSVNNAQIEPDEDGNYSFVVERLSKVVVAGAASGIAEVAIDNVAADSSVYNIHGVRLNTTGSTANLPAGIYIVGGRKVLVK